MPEDLKRLFLKKIKDSSESVIKALDERLVQPEDLDPKNEVQRRTVIRWSRDRKETIPIKFVDGADVANLVDMAVGDYDHSNIRVTSHPMEPEARAEVVKRLTVGWDKELVEALATRWRNEWRGSAKSVHAWPMAWQGLVEPHLSDPGVTADSSWTHLRPYLDPALEQRILSVRSNRKSRATFEKNKASGTSGKPTESGDALIASILKRDHARLFSLDLEKLKPERWKKVEKIWTESDSDHVKAGLMRLPWGMVGPHAAIALEAGAAIKADRKAWKGTKWPEWEIPKAVFLSLSGEAQTFWLAGAVQRGEMYDGSTKLTVPKPAIKITPPIGLAEIRTELVLDAIAGGETAALLDWLGWLEKWRRFRGLAVTDGPAENGKDVKMLLTVLEGTGMANRIYGDPLDLISGKDVAAGDSVRDFLHLLQWLFEQPEERRAALSRKLVRNQAFMDAATALFGSEVDAPVNFCLEGVDCRVVDAPAVQTV